MNTNSILFSTITAKLSEKKGLNILSLDLKPIEEAVADYFIIATGTSNVHIKAMADFLIDEVENIAGEKPYHVEYGDKWTLIDYVNIVVHLFQEEQREFYSIETLWEDAARQEHR
ncbi:MAG: ribosome silencing factor [Chitinophagia bacterium]|nr:ribosome silencing factor [Chitinophagia bacterium]